jgi:predicted Holliday junction resolvase-like endonuclease
MNISLSELLIFLLIILLYYLFDNIRFKINNLKDSIENKKNKVINNISDDPEKYHDVFSILYKLNDKLINMI